MKKGKFLSSLAAVALSVSMLLAPAGSAFASQTTPGTTATETATTPTKATYDVTIHKIVMSKADLDKNVFPADHDGTEMSNEQFNNKFGTSNAKEVKGVAFDLYEYAPDATKASADTKSAASLGVTEDTFTRFAEQRPELNDKTRATAYFKKVRSLGKTEATGLNVELDKGTYLIVENKNESTYKGEKGAILGEGKAVPFLISIPAVTASADGILHVYPKNTEGAPEIDKNFGYRSENPYNEETEKALYDRYEALRAEWADKFGADYEKYTSEKNEIVSQTIGSNVPYEVKTKLHAGESYEELTWSDSMDNGLTYNEDLRVFATQIKDNDQTALELTRGRDYVVDQDARGFDLILTRSGIEKVNAALAAGNDVEFALYYTALVNDSTLVDNPQNNDIKLTYSNNPSQSWTPVEVNPVNGEISVEKFWATNGDQTITPEDKNVKAPVYLEKLNPQTGQYEKVTGSDYTLTYEEQFKHTWTGLEDGATYRVVEDLTQQIVDGYDADYVSYEDGKVQIVDHKNETPADENGELDVAKSWTNSTNDQPVPNGAKVTYTLYDGDTSIGSVTVKADEVREGEGLRQVKGDAVGKEFVLAGTKGADGTPIKFVVGENLGGTFQNLTPGKSYKVRERVAGYRPIYEVNNAGTIEVTNRHRNDIPEPLNPREPQVVTHGKRFVKMDSKSETRLKGAEFKITNAAGEYLKVKPETEVKADEAAYIEADRAYKTAVAQATTENPNTAEILRLENARDRAYERAQNQWIFSKGEEGAYTLTSDENGRFEIRGLREGTYNIVETKAPDGYALPSNPAVEFTVGDGTYEKGEVAYNVGELKTIDNAKKVPNNSLTIPQTGGIGSLIFIVAGLAVMAVAFIGMRRRNAYEA